jgi:hypothetical protein
MTPRASNAKSVALIACFAPLYTLMSMWKIFPVVGVSGQFIDGSAIISCVFGLVLSPKTGVLAVVVGGLINLSTGLAGVFGPFSFLPHAGATFYASMFRQGKKAFCILIYLPVFLFFAFFPMIGPFWLWPQMLWLHMIALFLQALLLRFKAVGRLSTVESSKRLAASVCIITFTSVLFGHLVGNIVFESMFWQSISQLTWQLLTFQYAFERVTMMLIATIISVPLIKALNSYRLSIEVSQN